MEILKPINAASIIDSHPVTHNMYCSIPSIFQKDGVKKNVCSIPFDLEFIAAGTGEDIREATESESDSFASQQFFAEEALGGIEEELLGLKLWLL